MSDQRFGNRRDPKPELKSPVGVAGVVHFNPSHDDRGRFADGGDSAAARFRSNAGYVAHAKAKLGGHIVVYGARGQGLAHKGYAVMHEPSSSHIIVPSREQAIEMMHGLSQARSLEEAARIADIFPKGQNFNPNHDDRGEFATGPGGGAGGPHASGATPDGGGAARMFASVDAADHYGAGTQAWASNLTAKQEGALDSYTATVGVNGTLRANREPNDTDAVFHTRGPNGVDMTEADVVAGLDGVFAKPNAVTQDTLIVHRAWAQGGSIRTREVGDEFVDRGYTSTALVKSETDVFTKDPNTGRRMGIMVSIRVPKGTSAIYLGVKPRGREWFAGSSELLINRGTRYRVVSTDKDQFGGKAHNVVLAVVRPKHTGNLVENRSAQPPSREARFTWQDTDVEWER